MTFMWRRYVPMTKRFCLMRTFISHGPLDGNRMGVDGVKRGRWDSTLTKRTTPGRSDCPSKGSFEISRTMSRPWQTTISATKGSLHATSARAWAWVIGCRRISVPAAPILTALRCFSAAASMVGRKVLWPPTFTPLRKTTSATRFPSTTPRDLHSTAAMKRAVGDQAGRDRCCLGVCAGRRSLGRRICRRSNFQRRLRLPLGPQVPDAVVGKAERSHCSAWTEYETN
jgi:hypothetical protein